VAISPSATGRTPTDRYVTDAIHAARCATCGDRHATTREINSWAVMEPRMGIAHRFSTSIVVSPGARQAQCDASTSDSAGPIPPRPLTTSTVTTSRPMASTMPWSKSVQASASRPPKIV